MPAIDTFASLATGLDSILSNLATITPSDSAELETVTRAVYVSTAGSLTVVDAGGAQTTIANAIEGWHPIRVQQVRATGTTATGLIAGW